MKVGIYYNSEQVPSRDAATFSALFRAANADVSVLSSLEETEGIDRLLVLGGDGTVLRAAKRAAAFGIPLAGVNYGRVGFLTEFEKSDYDGILSSVLSEDCPILERTMLEIAIGDKRALCLNELALLREISPVRANRVEFISLLCDGRDAGSFMADGLIVATPTGSTAYSLSAGGSILTPDCAAFILTPVCSFSMKARPTVFPDTCALGFTLSEHDALMAYGDGEFLGKVTAETGLTVRKSPLTAKFLTRDKKGFFLKLTEKLG